jgi:hypothetical protein
MQQNGGTGHLHVDVVPSLAECSAWVDQLLEDDG